MSILSKISFLALFVTTVNWAADSTMRTYIEKGQLEKIEIFLKNNPSTDIHALDEKTGNSYLHVTCEKTHKNQSKIAKIFIDKKIDVNLKNKDGNNALFLACFAAFNDDFPSESHLIINALLDNGAKPNIGNSISGNTGVHPIDLAIMPLPSKCYLAQCNQGHILASLLLHGSDLTIGTDYKAAFSILKKTLKWFARTTLFSDLIPIKKSLREGPVIKLKGIKTNPSLLDIFKATFISAEKRLQLAQAAVLKEAIFELCLFDTLPPQIEKSSKLYQGPPDLKIEHIIAIANAFMRVYFDPSLLDALAPKNLLNKDENKVCLDICDYTPYEALLTLRKQLPERYENNLKNHTKKQAEKFCFATLAAQFLIITGKKPEIINDTRPYKKSWDIKILTIKR